MSWQHGMVAIGIAGFMAYRGLKKKSLSKSGAVAAFFVGGISMYTVPRSGVALIAFYLSSSKLTKMQAAKKEKLESEYKIGGQREAVQVLSCSLLASILSLAQMTLVGFDGPIFDASVSRVHSACLLGIAAHYACCAADTWASELGILNKEWPILITTLQRVPPGTNGGISSLGTVASIAGGTFIGLTMWVFGVARFGLAWTQDLKLIPFCAASGLIGSLIDSLLGATVQITWYDNDEKRIVPHESKTTRRICGQDWLNNHQVNMLSVFIVTIMGMSFAYVV